MLGASLAAFQLHLEDDLIQNGKQERYYVNSYLFVPFIEWTNSSYPRKG
jgi:hypothetical protein